MTVMTPALLSPSSLTMETATGTMKGRLDCRPKLTGTTVMAAVLLSHCP
ncbi:MAG: hypothetical protein MPK06_06440 [Alphaproteobacteria bacterium]|nr:hypothetical protein [Alphaproteobacteria bacterium]MDA8006157.1 hypothetical protein [Alphaproteobacteria bacterium]